MINYNKLIRLNPTEYEREIINSRGQLINFVENPLLGQDAPIIAVCHELQIAENTEHFDIDSFYKGSEENPIFILNVKKYSISYGK